MLKKIITGLVAAGVLAGATLAATSSAEAYPGYPYWKDPHHHYYGGYGGYGGYGYDNGGGAVAAGILGFIGGALLSDLGHRSYYGGGGYCESHFRTYNSTTHQYMGYDGNLHSCFD